MSRHGIDPRWSRWSATAPGRSDPASDPAGAGRDLSHCLPPRLERLEPEGLTPGAAMGVAAAWLVVAHVSEAFVRLAIGLVGVGLSLDFLRARMPARATRPMVASGLFWRILSGFASTFAQVGAQPYQLHILPEGLDKMTLVRTTVLFLASVNVLKVIPYFSLGQFSTDGLGVSLALLPLAIGTNFLGIWLVRRTRPWSSIGSRISWF